MEMVQVLCFLGNYRALRQLLESNPDSFNLFDQRSGSLLHFAVRGSERPGYMPGSRRPRKIPSADIELNRLRTYRLLCRVARRQGLLKRLLSSCDSEGNTPLHLAAAQGKTLTCAFLQKIGSSEHSLNYYQETPRQYAERWHIEETLRYESLRNQVALQLLQEQAQLLSTLPGTAQIDIGLRAIRLPSEHLIPAHRELPAAQTSMAA